MRCLVFTVILVLVGRAERILYQACVRDCKWDSALCAVLTLSIGCRHIAESCICCVLLCCLNFLLFRCDQQILSCVTVSSFFGVTAA